MELHQTQAIVASDPHRFRVINCGRRWGKTFLSIDQIKACAAYREARIAYIAPTFQQARDIAWEPLKKDCRSAALSINESRLEIRIKNIKGTESLIILRGWEAIETLRGQLFDLIVLDEVASMRDFWRSWQEVVRPTLTDRKGEALFISTPKGFNHFFDLYNLESGIGWEHGPDADFKSFHFTTYDNPHIPREEIDTARAQLTEDRFSQEYLADFRKTEGLVYKEFDRATHVLSLEETEKLEKETIFKEKIVGVDWGFTNPAAVPVLFRGADDTLYQLDEFYEAGHVDTEVADYVAALKPNRVFPDPESANGIEELKRRKVNIIKVVKGSDSIRHGIDSVRNLLKAGKYKVSARCVNTISEFETYSYPDRKPGHNEYEDPIKENDHMMDALRYVIMMTSVSSERRVAHQSVPSHLSRSPSAVRYLQKGESVPTQDPVINRTAHQSSPSSMRRRGKI